MATARKLPSGKWRVLVYAGMQDKKRVYKSFTADTKKDAELLAAEWAARKQPQRVEDMTLGEAYDRYIASKTNVLSPRTILDYKQHRQRDLPDLMSKNLSDISPELVQDCINEYAAYHSPKSCRNVHGLLSAVLRAYAPDIRLTTTLPQPIPPTIHVPTDAEIAALVVAVKDTPIDSAILLAAFGSLRRSEVCALTESDIDRGACTVTVGKAMVQSQKGEWVIKVPKSVAGYRTVSLPAEIMPRIKPLGMNPNQIYKRFKKALALAGLPDMRFHDLRHYQASILHALGVPDAYIMQRGGWKTDSTLKRVYRHAMGDKQSEFDQIAEAHFAGLISPKK